MTVTDDASSRCLAGCRPPPAHFGRRAERDVDFGCETRAVRPRRFPREFRSVSPFPERARRRSRLPSGSRVSHMTATPKRIPRGSRGACDRRARARRVRDIRARASAARRPPTRPSHPPAPRAPPRAPPPRRPARRLRATRRATRRPPRPPPFPVLRRRRDRLMSAIAACLMSRTAPGLRGRRPPAAERSRGGRPSTRTRLARPPASPGRLGFRPASTSSTTHAPRHLLGRRNPRRSKRDVSSRRLRAPSLRVEGGGEERGGGGGGGGATTGRRPQAFG